MIEHLQFNLNRLTATYPEAGIFIGGDCNNLRIDKIRSCYPDLVNLVTEPTHGSKILDVILSNVHMAYDRAVTLPPVQPDVVGQGVPSNHMVAVARPNVDKSRGTGFAKIVTKTRRVMTACTDWRSLYDANGVDAKLSCF